MKDYITIEEIKSDMSDIAIEGMDRLTGETIDNLKDIGLIGPELCYIALGILKRYSNNSRKLIKSMKNTSSLLEEADKLLVDLKQDKTIKS